MNNITGRQETSSSVLYLALPAMILHYIGNGISKHNSGFLINFVIWSIIAFVLLRIIKGSFSNEFNETKVSNFISKFTEAVILIFLVVITFYNFKSSTNAVYSVTSGVIKRNITALLPLIASLICALCGIEAITRSSYMLFFLFVGVVGFIFFITFDGWAVSNLYPLMGNNTHSTFSDYSVIGIYAPVLSTYVLRSNVKGKLEGYFLARRTMLVVFLSALVLGLVCILTIPYPMGTLYGFSLKGIFSIANSGSFFHRFEILLSFILMIIDIVSVAVGIYLISKILSDITDSNDYKPFCLVISLMIFYLDKLFSKTDVLIEYGVILSAVVFILLFLQSLAVEVMHKFRF